jgi:sugar O-acyltransferase (sialic acid O-acetyltransferase NeuD family)
VLDMTRKIIILGSVGNCIDILDTINDINHSANTPRYQCIGFLDDDTERWGKVIGGVSVLGGLETAPQYKYALFVNGIGSPANYLVKHKIISKANIPIERFETIVHPTAAVSSMAKLGKGAVIFQNVTITSNAHIGDHVCILPNSVISHDCRVGRYSCIAGGAVVSGHVTIGESCYLGANCSIKERIVIGARCLIGMGSVVIRNVMEGSLVVGNPARELKSLKNEEAYHAG